MNTKPSCYIRALKNWFGCASKEPNGLLKGSLMFIVCCLPVVTYGPARLAAVYYMGRRCDGLGVKWKDAVAFGFGFGVRVGVGADFGADAGVGVVAGGAAAAPASAGECRPGGKAWVMGFADGLAALLAAGSGYALLNSSFPLPLRFVYALLFIIDVIYFFSGIYRYPALARSPDVKLGLLMLRGFLLALGSPWWTFLFLCVNLLWLMLCALTGAGLPALYPAGAALLSHCAYTEMARHYTDND